MFMASLPAVTDGEESKGGRQSVPRDLESGLVATHGVESDR
jgi:hypothetical protein